MSHVLVAAVPFAGHALPVAGVAAELVARGHRVTAYTGATYERAFADAGCATVTWRRATDFDEDDVARTFPGADRPGVRGTIANVRLIFIGTAAGQVGDLEAIHRDDPIDAVAADIMAIGPGLFAERHGLPWATVGVLPLMYPSRHLPPSGLGLRPGRTPVTRLRDAVLRRVTGALARPMTADVDRVRTSLGLPPSRPFDRALYSPQLTLSAGSAALDFDRPDLPSFIRFIGRFDPVAHAFAAPDDRVAAALHGDRPVVLVTQGTHDTDPSDLVEPTLEGLAGEAVAVVATTMDRTVGAVPENAVVVPSVAYSAVLERAAVMVTNGGWGGVLAGLAHAVPLVVAGSNLDKPEIARRVAASGAGIDLGTGSPSPTAVRAAVRRALEDVPMRRRAAEVGAELRALGGTRRAGELLDAFVRGERPFDRDR